MCSEWLMPAFASGGAAFWIGDHRREVQPSGLKGTSPHCSAAAVLQATAVHSGASVEEYVLQHPPAMEEHTVQPNHLVRAPGALQGFCAPQILIE